MTLRFTEFSHESRLPRDEVPTPDVANGTTFGRRLTGNGRLSGALHTLGYYSTDVCLGSPGRRFDLIVDTGSSITAVPCSTCRQCGTHRCGRTGCFDPKRSPSYQPVDCHKPPTGFSCEKCAAANRCQYSVHYTEGSAIQGHVVTDYAHFTRISAAGVSETVSTRVYFGCQTLETGMFHRQEADGIMGLQPPRARARVPSFLTSLVHQQKAASEAFSLCLSDRTGLFLLGGQPDPQLLLARGALSLPMDRTARARYTLSLSEILVSGAGKNNGTYMRLAGVPASSYSPTLVDSGTTFVYVSTPLFKALHAHLKATTPSLTREGGKVCAYLSDAQLAAMPNLRFMFASQSTPLLVRPRQYMVEFPKISSGSRAGSRHLCAAIFDNQRGGTVIGASIMRQREVIFDLASSMITFLDADCSATTPATSAMRGAYAFAPCPKSNMSEAAAGMLTGPGRIADAVKSFLSRRAGSSSTPIDLPRATSVRTGRGGKDNAVIAQQRMRKRWATRRAAASSAHSRPL